MTDEVAVDRRGHRWSRKWVGMSGRDRSGTVGALLSRSFELRIVADCEFAALVHAHHAVMLAVTSAARRQARLRVLSHSQHGKDKREAEHGQQQNGDKPSQWVY